MDKHSFYKLTELERRQWLVAAATLEKIDYVDMIIDLLDSANDDQLVDDLSSALTIMGEKAEPFIMNWLEKETLRYHTKIYLLATLVANQSPLSGPTLIKYIEEEDQIFNQLIEDYLLDQDLAAVPHIFALYNDKNKTMLSRVLRKIGIPRIMAMIRELGEVPNQWNVLNACFSAEEIERHRMGYADLF